VDTRKPLQITQSISGPFRFALRNNDFKAGTLLVLGNLKLALHHSLHSLPYVCTV